MTIEAVGSYNDFVNESGEQASTEMLEAYSKKLSEYRLAQAAALGITLESLHDSKQEGSV